MGISDPAVIALSVSQLNQLVGELVGQCGELQVEGEVSNFTASAAGHWYFSLKDEQAQVSCVLFGAGKPGTATYRRKQLEQGDVVTVTARPGIYQVRGSFQLMVSSYSYSGEGRLFKRIAELQYALAQEGVFDASHKKPLPEHCNSIGVVTSASGAALTDIVKTCRRRSPATVLFVYPCLVQGEGAAESIVAAIGLARLHGECDALIVGRGGGSFEDLMAYNDEALVRAIHACALPVISAVGHEHNTALTDLVADGRASTPTAAAEMLTADSQVQMQQCDEVRTRLSLVMDQQLERAQWQLARFKSRLHHPAERIERAILQLGQLRLRLQGQIEQGVRSAQARLAPARAQLVQLDPRRVLRRGYAMVTAPDGGVIASSKVALAQKEIAIHFADGEIKAEPKPQGNSD